MKNRQFPRIKPICHKCKVELDWIMFPGIEDEKWPKCPECGGRTYSKYR